MKGGIKETGCWLAAVFHQANMNQLVDTGPGEMSEMGIKLGRNSEDEQLYSRKLFGIKKKKQTRKFGSNI